MDSVSAWGCLALTGKAYNSFSARRSTDRRWLYAVYVRLGRLSVSPGSGRPRLSRAPGPPPVGSERRDRPGFGTRPGREASRGAGIPAGQLAFGRARAGLSAPLSRRP